MRKMKVKNFFQQTRPIAKKVLRFLVYQNIALFSTFRPFLLLLRPSQA